MKFLGKCLKKKTSVCLVELGNVFSREFRVRLFCEGDF